MVTEPVSIGNLVSVIFAIFGTVLAKYGITEDDATQVFSIIGTIVSAIVVLYSWWKQRSKVTPLARPQNNDGVPLIPDPNV